MKKLYALILVAASFCSFAFASTDCSWIGSQQFDMFLYPGAPCGGAMFGATVQLQCGGGTGYYCPAPHYVWNFYKVLNGLGQGDCTPKFQQSPGCMLSTTLNAGCGTSSGVSNFCYSPTLILPTAGYYEAQLSFFESGDCNSSLICSRKLCVYYNGFGSWSTVSTNPCP